VERFRKDTIESHTSNGRQRARKTPGTKTLNHR
jgi:hypothetical protein